MICAQCISLLFIYCYQLWNLIGHSEPATASVTTQQKPVSKYKWPTIPSLLYTTSNRAKAAAINTTTATTIEQSSMPVFGFIASGNTNIASASLLLRLLFPCITQYCSHCMKGMHCYFGRGQALRTLIQTDLLT
jgi:hypothetical protein